MVKRVGVLFLICIELFLLPGCWDYEDLEDQLVPVVGIYDLAKSEGNMERIKVGAISPVFYKKTEEQYTIKVDSGQTVADTREKRAAYLAEDFNVGMLQVGVYGEGLARKGLRKVTDILLRSQKVKNTLYMAVIENDTEGLAKIKLKDYPNPGIFLLGLLKTAKDKSFLPTTNLFMFALNEETKGRNPIIPLLKIENENSIKISGTGIFKKDKLIAKVNNTDTLNLVILRGLEGKGYIPYIVEKKGQKIDKGTVFVKRSRKVKVTRDGDEFTFRVKITLQGDLIEHNTERFFLGTKETESLKDVENSIKRHVERDCQRFIQKMQKDFKVDCIDITKYALAKWRKELEDKVDTGFIENVKIIPEVEVKIKRVGELT